MLEADGTHVTGVQVRGISELPQTSIVTRAAWCHTMHHGFRVVRKLPPAYAQPPFEVAESDLDPEWDETTCGTTNRYRITAKNLSVQPKLGRIDRRVTILVTVGRSGAWPGTINSRMSFGRSSKSSELRGVRVHAVGVPSALATRLKAALRVPASASRPRRPPPPQSRVTGRPVTARNRTTSRARLDRRASAARILLPTNPPSSRPPCGVQMWERPARRVESEE